MIGKVGQLQLSELVYLVTSSKHLNLFIDGMNDYHEQFESFFPLALESLPDVALHLDL